MLDTGADELVDEATAIELVIVEVDAADELTTADEVATVDEVEVTIVEEAEDSELGTESQRVG